MQKFVGAIVVAIVALNLFSCKPAPQLQYVQGYTDTLPIASLKIPEPIIQKGDLLSIVVYSDNAQLTSLYNLPMANATDVTSGGSMSAPVGYLVDSDGNIQFQGLGLLHVQGLNKKGLADLLNSKLKDTLLQNPYYVIRFLNFKVTMLGDVARPGVYTIPAERVNIFEAIGLAGDLTVYGRKDNVLIIREADGMREVSRINLSDSNIFNSPYYYLKQNDIVSIESNKFKNRQSEEVTLKYISLGASIISTAAIVITVLRR